MVVAIRHGQTDWNATKGGGDVELYRGHSNISLNDQGRREALEAAHKIGLPVRMVVSDQMPRDFETAAIVAADRNAPHVIDDRLAPINIGLLSGKSVKEVADLVDWFFHHPDIPFPDGDAVGDWYERQKGAIFDYLDEDHGDRSSAIVLIVQGSTFRTLPAMMHDDDWSLIEPTTERVPTGDLKWLT
jgi:broad specificity phosphatase PhoE